MPPTPKPNCGRCSTCRKWIGALVTCWRCCWRTKDATRRRGHCWSEVADADPPDGFAAYFAAQQRLTTAPAEALAWYEKAAAREPLLRSAYYGAFLALRRLGRDAEAKDMLARFQDLERNPQARVAEFKVHANGTAVGGRDG